MYSSTTYPQWNEVITTASVSDGTSYITLDIGTNGNWQTSPIAQPWAGTDLQYQWQGQRFAFADDQDRIKVDKGSPTKARYAIFYAVKTDPVIFCKTRREMYKEVKKLLKRKEVDPRSIRIFALIGGAKKAKRIAAK